MTRLIRKIVFLIFTATLVALYFFYSNATKHAATPYHGTILKTPRNVSDFSLLNQQKQPFTQQNLKGQWTVMFFGFTSCPDICPTTMTNLAKWYQILEQKGARNLPQVILVSVDPERDTPDHMKKYIHAFNPKFMGVTGKISTIDRLTKEVGVAYMKMAKKESTDPMDYGIEHSGTLMLFNPEGKLQGFFTTPHDLEKIAQDYLRLTA